MAWAASRDRPLKRSAPFSSGHGAGGNLEEKFDLTSVQLKPMHDLLQRSIEQTGFDESVEILEGGNAPFENDGAT